MENIYPDFPFRVEFEVTSVCNLDCKYCYAKPFTWKTPSFANMDFLFRKTKEEANPFEIVLVGGEPFIRKDILLLIKTANKIFKKGVQVSTNGTLLPKLNNNQIKKLKDVVQNGVSFQVSIDSFDPTINDNTRGKTLESVLGINILEKNGIPFSVGIVLTKVNSNDIIKTISRLLTDYSYLVSLNLEPLQPTSILKEEYFELKQENKKIRNLYKTVSEVIKTCKRDDVKLYGVVEDCSESIKFDAPVLDSYAFKTCTAGIVRSAVFVDGSVTPCSLIRDIKIGNLYIDSWVDIWKRSKERFDKIKDNGFSQCAINILSPTLRSDSSFISLESIITAIKQRKKIKN
ncbi:MAG: radical SAM protein [Candidatus Parvarchaeum sp.]